MTDIMDTVTLGDAQNIVLDQTRATFPEPTLIPHLAHSIPFDELPDILGFINSINNDNAYLVGGRIYWTRLLDATYAIVAKRMERSPANVIAPRILEYGVSNCLYSHIGESLIEIAIKPLLSATSEWQEQRAERLCRLASRYPNYNNGGLLDMANAALLDLEPLKSLLISSWLLPLATPEERGEIIAAWLASDWSEFGTLAFLFENANDQEREQLTASFLTYCETSDRSDVTLVNIAEVLP